MRVIDRKIIFVQPTLPSYRVDFFDRVSKIIDGKVQVFYSPAGLGALTELPTEYPWAHRLGAIKPIFPGAEWQQGALTVPFSRNDIVVVSGGPRCLSNMAVLLRARLSGAKVIWWGQYWTATTKKHRLLLRLLLMKLAHGVLFYTDDEVAAYRNTYGKKDPRPISALNNGLNLDPIAANRTHYDPISRGNTLLFIGRLTDKAHLDLLLQALALPSLSGVALHVIGDGQHEVKLKQLAEKLGIQSRVVWHKGTTDEQEIARVANQCALFVYPGAVGLSLIHAMAYGLPAIVHGDRDLHMPEITAFSDMETGKEFQRDSAGSLAQSIAEMLGSSALRGCMSEGAVCRVEKYFNTEAMANRLVSLVSRI